MRLRGGGMGLKRDEIAARRRDGVSVSVGERVKERR